MNFLSYFDKLINITPRDEQVQVLDSLEKEWENYDYFIISAPPGVGKTHIALAICEAVKSAYVLTSTKPLQEQYVDHSSKVVNLYGRPNYVCAVNELFTSDAAPCHANDKIKRDCIASDKCPYYSQRDRAMASQIFSTNYAYFLFASYCGPLSAEEVQPRSVLIMDECHEVPSHLINFAETKLNLNNFYKRYEIGDPNWRFSDDNEENEKTLRMIFKLVEQECIFLKDLMERQMAGDVDDISLAIVEQVQSIRRKHSELDRILQSLNVYYNTRDENEWVVKADPAENEIVLSPLYAASLFELYVEKTADKFVFMSATPGSKEVAAKELGLDPSKVCFIEVNTPFPPEKSPIIPLPVGKMGYKDIDNTIPGMVQCIDELIAGLHPDEKGVIHTSNYKIADAVYNQVSPEVRSRMIYRDMYLPGGNRLNNTQMLEVHEASEKPTILVSPSMTTGIDLDGDLSRFQIITKLPFLSLGDPRIKRKSDIDSDWYRMQMWMTIAQAACRSTRSMEDHSTTYILDSSLQYFLGLDVHSLPDWLLWRLLPNMR